MRVNGLIIWVYLYCHNNFVGALELPFARRSFGARTAAVSRKIGRPAVQSSPPAFLSNSVQSSNDEDDRGTILPQNQQAYVNHIKDHRDADSADIDELLLLSPEDEPEFDAESIASHHDSNGWMLSEDIEILFHDDEDVHNGTHEDHDLESENIPLDAMERAWRYCKKPLLRVGSKGAQFSHGNSLRQLLEAHQVVKVKVNTTRFGTYRGF